MRKQPQHTYTTGQAGAVLGLNQSTLYRYAQSGRVPAKRVGSRYVFDWFVIELLAKQRASKGKP